MNLYKINQIPVIDKKRNLINVFFSDTIETPFQYDNPVIIMAGGFGKRLMPITKNCPKPLLPVLGKPVLEHIITKLKNEGFNNIYISTHYLANMIKDYFGNGKNFGVSIKYIDEKIPLGTAGCLSKFEPKNEREYFWKHPFGVIKTKGFNIKSITEKPIEKTYVNAGIYVFKNKIKNIIQKDKKIEMPEFFRILKRKKYNTIVFPMFENWLDIGDTKEYERAQKKYN